MRADDLPFDVCVVAWRQMQGKDLPGLTDEELDKEYEQRERQEAEKRAVEEGLES
jgi:hypothetical protein